MACSALIIGYSSIGARHAQIISNMIDFDILTVLSSQENLPFNTVTHLIDIIEINPDYIVIASNTSLHFEQLKFLEDNFAGR